MSKRHWSKLSAKQKATVISFAAKNGITDLKDIMDAYDSYIINQDTDYGYDMSAAKASGLLSDGNGHYDDVFKTPQHPTFSTSSMYHSEKHPGGKWSRTEAGKDIYEPSEFVINRQGGWNNFLRGFSNQEGDRAYKDSYPVYNGGTMLPEITVNGNKKRKGGKLYHKHSGEEDTQYLNTTGRVLLDNEYNTNQFYQNIQKANDLGFKGQNAANLASNLTQDNLQYIAPSLPEITVTPNKNTYNYNTPVNGNRDYWTIVKENLKEGWDKFKVNDFANQLFPFEELSKSNTLALMPLIIPGGQSIKKTSQIGNTILKNYKSVLRSGMDSPVRSSPFMDIFRLQIPTRYTHSLGRGHKYRAAGNAKSVLQQLQNDAISGKNYTHAYWAQEEPLREYTKKGAYMFAYDSKGPYKFGRGNFDNPISLNGDIKVSDPNVSLHVRYPFTSYYKEIPRTEEAIKNTKWMDNTIRYLETPIRRALKLGALGYPIYKIYKSDKQQYEKQKEIEKGEVNKYYHKHDQKAKESTNDSGNGFLNTLNKENVLTLRPQDLNNIGIFAYDMYKQYGPNNTFKDFIDLYTANDRLDIFEPAYNAGFLPEVTVVPSKKDKEVLQYIRELIPNKNYRNQIMKFADEAIEQAYEKIKPQEQSYLGHVNDATKNLALLYNISGSPKFQSTPDNFTKFIGKFIDMGNTDKNRAYMRGFPFNKLYNINSYNDFIAELSHSFNYKNIKDQGRFISGLRNRSVYDTPYSMEHTTHTYTEPLLDDYVRNTGSRNTLTIPQIIDSINNQVVRDKQLIEEENLKSTGGPLYPFSFNGYIPEVRYKDGGNLKHIFNIGGKTGYPSTYFSNFLKGTMDYLLRRKNPKSFIKSQYVPTIGNNGESYYTRKDLKNEVALNLFGGTDAGKTNYGSQYFYENFDDAYNKLKSKGDNRVASNGTLGRYRVFAGEDDRGRYISFTDKFDFEILPGKPIHIYDRIYEDELNDVYNPNESALSGYGITASPLWKKVKSNGGKLNVHKFDEESNLTHVDESTFENMMPELTVYPEEAFMSYNGKESRLFYPTFSQYIDFQINNNRREAVKKMNLLEHPIVPYNWRNPTGGSSCLNTITSVYGKKHAMAGNRQFDRESKKVGFIKVNDPYKAGDIIQYITGEDIPYHAAMITGFENNDSPHVIFTNKNNKISIKAEDIGTPLVSYSNGSHKPWDKYAIRHNVPINYYLNNNNDMSIGSHYRFIGTEKDRKNWAKEYYKLYKK